MPRGSDILARSGSQPCRKRRSLSSLRGRSSVPSSRGYHRALPASMIDPKTQWHLKRRHTSGTVGHNVASDCQSGRAAQGELRAVQRRAISVWTRGRLRHGEEESGAVHSGEDGVSTGSPLPRLWVREDWYYTYQ